MRIIIKYKADVYKYDKKTKKDTLVKRGAIYEEQITIDDIVSVRTYYNDKGEPDINRCILIHKQFGDMLVEQSFSSLTKHVESDQFEVKGFKIETSKLNGKETTRSSSKQKRTARGSSKRV